MTSKIIFSNNCTQTIGCRIHRKWDIGFVRRIGYQPTGFSDINTKNSNKSNTNMDTKAKQYLCFIANHEILNHIMKKKSYSVKKLEEFNENEYKTDYFTKCYGLNSGMGTDKIAIRLRYNNAFISYDTIIDTMIHELTHMDVTDHNQLFYKKQDELRKIYNSFEKINWHNESNKFDVKSSYVIMLFSLIFALIFSTKMFFKYFTVIYNMFLDLFFK